MNHRAPVLPLESETETTCLTFTPTYHYGPSTSTTLSTTIHHCSLNHYRHPALLSPTLSTSLTTITTLTTACTSDCLQ
ncbi:hypothetical protein E2C01_029809 [Portunus trituberculatus]|uniref:Uncharacterized protein n=1 Tax=Portunus trituberculatus TaxID=210409 RepID=A0A5B7ETX4_PORTR|nr:hypothetical protein [Portunus trituberculatus]